MPIHYRFKMRNGGSSLFKWSMNFKDRKKVMVHISTNYFHTLFIRKPMLFVRVFNSCYKHWYIHLCRVTLKLLDQTTFNKKTLTALFNTVFRLSDYRRFELSQWKNYFSTQKSDHVNGYKRGLLLTRSRRHQSFYFDYIILTGNYC